MLGARILRGLAPSRETTLETGKRLFRFAAILAALTGAQLIRFFSGFRVQRGPLEASGTTAPAGRGVRLG